MKIQQVVDRALQDPFFAAELAAKAGRAAREADAQQRAGGETWEELLREFADGPEELSRLFVEPGGALAGKTTVTVTTTVTTLSTGACTTTTTTTVTTLTTDFVVEEA